MVVTAQAYATRVGVEVLKKGGNAVDAAVAVGYALAVVYPAAGNLGGGGFITLQLADGRTTFIDFRETAPLAATANMYLGKDGNVVPELSTRGHLAVAVPGSVAGLEYARGKYGTRPRAELIAPAIKLAEGGYVLGPGDTEMFREATEDFRKDAPSAAIFLSNGRPLEDGATLVQRDLARTLRNISRRGTAGFYQGETATALVAASKSGGGILTQADLDAYQVRELPPLECDYRGLRIVSAPPPSSGGLALCEMLNVLEGYPLADLGWGSARAVHFEIEAMRHAYVDRNNLLGDPAFVRNPFAELLDKDYAKGIRARIDPQRAGDSTQMRPGLAAKEGIHTTHYSIADGAGNAIAVTYTLNDWFGARVTPKGTGVVLNDEMDDFTAKPGVPNMYGLVQGEANKIEPGKATVSSMTPTIVQRDGKPWMVVGTPGGSRIITAVIAHSAQRRSTTAWTSRKPWPRRAIHQQWMPQTTFVERGALSPDTQAISSAWGTSSRVPAPEKHRRRDPDRRAGARRETGAGMRFYGALDPRRATGLALGY
jgi:gamma-glutamyltranspeptidase/glutathione hydrolase